MITSINFIAIMVFAHLQVYLSILFQNGELTPTNAIIWNITASKEMKRKDKVTILNSVCGAARRGKIHAIIGPSGSGKSTLLNTLAKVTRPVSVSTICSFGIVIAYILVQPCIYITFWPIY